MKHLLLFPLLLTLFSGLGTAQTTPYLNQDCVGAVPLCYGRYELPYSFTGEGTVDELHDYYLNNSTFCLEQGENNSAWYKLQFDAPGQLVFLIEPYSSDDYDFALFDMTGRSCVDIVNSTAPHLRCTFSLGQGQSTGLAFDSVATSADPNGSHVLAPLDVDSGDVIYLVIDNFTRNGEGFAIDFTGTTAGMTSDDSFYVTSGYTTLLPDTIKVDMFFNQSFYCGTLSTDFSEFILVTDLGDTLDVLSVDCDSTLSKVTVNTLYPVNPVVSVTVYYKDGFDGNILISQCGGAELNGTPKTFEARNAPGKLDFSHLQVSNTFTFTPIADIIGTTHWYVNDTLRYVNAPNHGYSLPLNAYQPYRVCLEADYGYLKDSVCKSFYITGLADLAPYDAFTIYPNPAQNEVTITLPYGAKTIEVMDLSGKVVQGFEGIATGQTVTFNTVGLPQGLYFVRVAHTKGIATQKLQVLH